MPIPVAFGRVIPGFKASLSGIMSVSGTGFCMLTLCYVFYVRHDINRFYWSVLESKRKAKWIAKLLPVLLIVVSAFCFFTYFHELTDSGSKMRELQLAPVLMRISK